MPLEVTLGKPPPDMTAVICPGLLEETGSTRAIGELRTFFRAVCHARWAWRGRSLTADSVKTKQRKNGMSQ